MRVGPPPSQSKGWQGERLRFAVTRSSILLFFPPLPCPPCSVVNPPLFSAFSRLRGEPVPGLAVGAAIGHNAAVEPVFIPRFSVLAVAPGVNRIQNPPMRMLDVLPDEEQARRFGDYLLTRGINNQVEPGGGGWMVWWRRRPARAGRRGTGGVQGRPAGRPFREAARGPTRSAASGSGGPSGSPSRWTCERVEPPPRPAGRITVTLIAMSIGVGLLTHFGMDPSPGHSKTFVPVAAHAGPGHMGLGLLFRGELWWLFTPMFMHLGRSTCCSTCSGWRTGFGSSRSGPPLARGLRPDRRRDRQRGRALRQRQPGTARLRHLRRGASASAVCPASSTPCSATSGSAAGRPVRGPEGLAENAMIMFVWPGLCMTGIIRSVANVAHLVGLLGGMAAGSPLLGRRVRR